MIAPSRLPPTLLRLAPLALAALLLGTSATVAQDASPEEAPSLAPAAPAIAVSEVALRPLRDRVVASGLVAAVEEVQVQPLVEGQPIDALLAEVGDRVAQGQVLARLSGSTLAIQLSELVASLAQAEAGVAQAEASLIEAEANAAEAGRVAGRNAQLAEQGTVPRAQAEASGAGADVASALVRVAEQGVASAQAQGELARAQIATLRLQLDRTEVRAPVAGLVVARDAQVGAVGSTSGSALFTLVRDGAMELRVEVSEQDLLRLAPGQPVSMLATNAGEPLAGTVRLVEPSIDLATRLGTARIAIDDPSRVVQGMFLSAEVLAAEAQGLAVPVTAISMGEDGPAVMRVRDGLVERALIVTGIRDGGLVGVTAGLAEGDLVVTKAAAFVRDGDQINPVPDGAAEAPELAANADTSGTNATNTVTLAAAEGN